MFIIFFSDLNDSKKIVKLLQGALKQNSYLLIKVANETHPYKDQEDKIVFTSTSIVEEMKFHNLELIGGVIKSHSNLLCLFSN